MFFKNNNLKKNFSGFFDSESLNKVHKRIFFATSLFILIYICIFIKLSNIMIISKINESDTNKISENKIIDINKRGDIYDRNKELLATSVRSFSLFVRPDIIKEKKIISNKLSKILNINEIDILKKLEKKSKFVWIKRNISPTEHQRIYNIGEIGLQIIKEQRRIYPQEALTSHVVGYVNIDGEGLSGIEKGMNKILNNGKDIYLSLDLRLQNLITEELQRSINKFDAKGGIGIILDIDNGQILAMSNIPSFNPNNIKSLNGENRMNMANAGVFEMGSTFKPITMAIGFDSNTINESSNFPVGDPLVIGNKSIKDHSPQKGSLNIKEIIVHSSNIGTAQVALAIGKEQQKNYLEKFGLFEKLLTEMPEPETGTPIIPKYWEKSATATIGYGYGISITPLQLCSTYATLVNGGYSIIPTFLKMDRRQKFIKVLNDKTSLKIRDLLRAVVLETKYTGPSVRALGYEVGGKTGTTEIMTKKGYHKKANLSSFIGVFPISKPKYIIYTMIREANGISETQFKTTGGWIAAPVVGRIIKRMINIIGIEPIKENDFFIAKLNSNLN